MRVNEIVREERLDEIAPLAAVIPMIPVIISGLLAALRVMSAYELYKLFADNDFDFDNFSDDELDELVISAILTFIPVGRKFGREVLLKYTPDFLKKKARDAVKDKIASKRDELRKIRDQNKTKNKPAPGASTAEKQRAQAQLKKDNKAAAAKYKQEADKLVAQRVKGQLLTTVGLIASVPLVHTYFTKISELDDQYKLYKEGNRETEIFGNMGEREAWELYRKLRSKYIGELAIGLVSAISYMPMPKKIEAFMRLVGRIPGAKVAKNVLSSIPGVGLVKLPVTIATKLARLGGPGLTVLMQTEAGQKFMANSIVELITTATGAVTEATINILASVLDSVLGKVGIDTNIRDKVDGEDRPRRLPPKDVNKTGIYSDPKNPNIKYINGQQVTGADGYILNTIPSALRDIKRNAAMRGLPNPLDQLKYDPNKQYTNLEM